MKAPDITQDPTLYVVPYAHLDTQWRWEMPQTISEYLLKTMRVNFDYIDKYPHYVFNWTGSNRYRMMKEYFPDDYAKLTQYVSAGRWYPAGSSVEEGDVNLPSAEGIFRQILYGNEYYRKDFGKASAEYMLPDCFGFPASLPSILAHAGVKGFSTQKLSAAWQPAPQIGGPDSPEHTPEGIPFNVGLWIGPDGKSVIAALNPGGYGSSVYTDLSKDPGPPPPQPNLTDEQKAKLTPGQLRALGRPREWEQDWVKRIDLDGHVTGVFADYHYVGTGDVGGAARESTAKLLEAIVDKSETVLPPPPRGFGQQDQPGSEPQGPTVRVGEGPVHVVEATADQMFNDIKPDMTSRMPQYKGDLELINHSAGSLTSQAYHKRMILRNELLADAAEKASVAAAWMGGRPYPQATLERCLDAGTRRTFSRPRRRHRDSARLSVFLERRQYRGQPVCRRAYQRHRGDRFRNGHPGEGNCRRGLQPARYRSGRCGGSPASRFPAACLRLSGSIGPDGKEAPAQLEDGKVLFLAQAPSVGYAVYHLVPAEKPAANETVKVTQSSLENARYRVQLNQDGDVSSIYDKSLNKELLSAPIRLAISTDVPKQYPAWNMDFDQEQAAPRAYVSGPAQIRIKENGPVRVSLEVTRKAENSTFVQTIRLSAGDAGNRVEFGNAIDWRTLAANLKVAFPLSAANENATYNWDIGTIQRPNAQERQFEVASHRWIDLTDKSGAFGATILTEYKNGSDKPNDHTIRLTLLRSPGMQPSTNGRPQGYTDQANQDWGHHEFVFGLAGHADGWAQAQTDWQAYRLSDPLIAFQATEHPGALGKSISLLHLNNSRVRVLALKKAEADDEIILRMVELDGHPAQDVRVSFAGPIVAAREVNAQEQEQAEPASLNSGELVTSFTAYQPRTFALRLGPPTASLAAIHSQPVDLKYDLAAASNDDTKTEGGGFDGKGNAMPAEMLPTALAYHGVEFKLAPAKTGVPDAVVAKGQAIPLPSGHYNRVYLLAASADGDQTAAFRVGAKTANLNIEDWGGFIGQWDTRIFKNQDDRNWAISAHHAPWPPADQQQREQRVPSPRYPEDYVGLEPGYVKPASLAWYASHHHTADGLNQPYQYSYLFAYSIPMPPGTQTLTLPNNEKIRILAVSVAEENPELTQAQPLYDMLSRTEPPTGEPSSSNSR